MRLLIIKLSSLGDVIHALPALSDATEHIPELHCDWLVEESFAEIPTWHPAVKRVIPTALRRWRKHAITMSWRKEWQHLKQQLGAEEYDCIIDAQGLLKSAWLTRYARGPKHGLDRHSAREPVASLLYQHTHSVSWAHHAVTRVRHLFAAVLGYQLSDSPPNYGLIRRATPTPTQPPVLLFFHGASWRSKCWPECYWIESAQRAATEGFQVRLPWGNEAEYQRAQRIARASSAQIIPRTDLTGMAVEISRAQAVVGVDTGMSHLAAALGVPSITIYGATNPEQTGTFGPRQQHLVADFPCAPCLRRHCRFKGTATVMPACYADLTPTSIMQSDTLSRHS